MKISKALKVKNRFAGELAKLQGILARENSRRSDGSSQVDREAVDFSIEEARGKLIAIKAAITVASSGIARQLAELAETKAEISYTEGLPTKHGTEQVHSYGGTTATTVTYDAYINQEEVDKRISELQVRANALQDSIDEYNATTDVAFDE